jgi:pimeloyl-ACP methyl ester carboxylesterase
MEYFKKSRRWATTGLMVGMLVSLQGMAGAVTLPAQLPTPPPLNWQPCPNVPGRDCATLTVPLNYANLSEGTIDLPVARARAADTAHRVGPLVFNPGGPGESAAGLIRNQDLNRFFSSELQSKFDIIGFDPRGTTEGISCLTTSAEKADYWETNHLPRTTTELTNILTLERKTNEKCIDNNGPLVRHVDTASAVRDMEQLRRAMGVSTFNYMGRSYGTFLGNRYAVLFPGHLRAMVLDAVVDHSVPDTQSFKESNIAFDKAWSDFKTWCQALPASECSLHGQNIDAVFDQLLAQARTNPIPAPNNPTGNRPVNDWILTTMVQAVVAPGSVTFGWADKMISEARSGDASLTRLLYDSGTGYAGDGEYFIGGEQHRAIICEDTAWSQILSGPAQVQSLVNSSKVVAPRFGEANVFQGPAQCYKYPVPPVEAPPVASNVAAGQPPVLVVGATDDTTTPLIWAQRIASKIPGSRLLVRQGEGHISYDKSSCTQQKVDRYLVDLTLPPAGTTCSTDLYPVIPPIELGPQSTARSEQNVQQVLDLAR